jgi:DNA-binding transcriptional LysR family regulator
VGRADNLDWNDLRYFLAAVRAHSLAGAARELGVKHTTVGRRLTALERALGGALFMRTPDGLKLTALGKKLVPVAEQIERSVQTLRAQSSAHQSTVRIAVPSGFINLFTPHLPKFRKANPQTILEFLSGSKKVDLMKGDAELALRAGTQGDDALITRKAGEITWSLYASLKYLEGNPFRASAPNLSGHQLVGFDSSLSGMPAAKWLAEKRGDASVEVRHHEVVDMVASAAGGIGIAILPCAYGDNDARLKRLTDEVLVRTPMSLVYRRDVTLAGPVRAAMSFVIEVMRQCK